MTNTWSSGLVGAESEGCLLSTRRIAGLGRLRRLIGLEDFGGGLGGFDNGLNGGRWGSGRYRFDSGHMAAEETGKTCMS